MSKPIKALFYLSLAAACFVAGVIAGNPPVLRPGSLLAERLDNMEANLYLVRAATQHCLVVSPGHAAAEEFSEEVAEADLPVSFREALEEAEDDLSWQIRTAVFEIGNECRRAIHHRGPGQ